MLPIADADLSGLASVLGWSAVLLAIIFVAFFAYTQFKRWMKTPDEEITGGFTLSDLRELHRQGKLTKEEFEATKAKIFASNKHPTSGVTSDKPTRVKPSKNIPPDTDPEAGR